MRDIFYILFRHKWMIAIISLLAIATAVTVNLTWPVLYQTEAKLIIKWVTNSHAPDQTMQNSQLMSSPDDRSGPNIINSEVAILTSEDVVAQAVDVIGPSNLLARAGGGSNRVEAISYAMTHLTNEVPKQSDVIIVSFKHPDPAMAQQFLSQMISAYLKKHSEIHRPEISDYLRGQIDTCKGKLNETDKELRSVKQAAGIISLDDSRKQAGDETGRLEREIRETQADMAAEQAIIEGRQKVLSLSTPLQSGANVGTNAPASSNQPPPVAASVVAEYQRLNAMLVSLRAKEQELLGSYTTNNPHVQFTQTQIANTEAKCRQMEEQNPALLAVKPMPAPAAAAGPAGPDPKTLLNEEILKQGALTLKFQVLTNQLAQENAKSASISGSEGQIIELQRNRDLYERQLEFYQTKLDAAGAEQAIGPGNSNVALAEQPTIAFRNAGKLMKACIGILVGGLALALALPFVIELYLDQSLKRVSEIQTKLGVPSFITLPRLNGNARQRLNGAVKVPLLTAGAAAAGAGEPSAVGPLAPPAGGEIAPWDDQHALRPFFETLRDRLMTYFEMINLTHKPKLVAITSCGHHAGVTTTAAGLASSLSETGDGNVLLVDMNVRDGEAHHFYKGKLTCPLEEVLEKRDDALVHGNLYIAKDGDPNDKLPRVLPKRFSHLVPKMRASDYDYIIFDMPPISQISITPRLARFMDMVLLVVESGKTDSDTARRATALLTESKTNVGVVLNKSREYLPRSLQQDI